MRKLEEAATSKSYLLVCSVMYNSGPSRFLILTISPF